MGCVVTVTRWLSLLCSSSQRRGWPLLSFYLSLFSKKYTLSLSFFFVSTLLFLSFSLPHCRAPPLIPPQRLFLFSNPLFSSYLSTFMSNNHRASLLNGLRTGGVRSVSTNFPHSAAPGAATFNLSRFPPHPEDEGDQFLDIPQHLNNRNIPMTSAVDGNNHFNLQQAHYPINQNNFSFSPAFPQVSSPAPHNQAMSMQMLQLEMMRIQVSFPACYPIFLTSSSPYRRRPSRTSNIRQN